MDTSEYPNHFTDTQVASMLGKHPVTVRKWRLKNTEAGCIKHGPPYEFVGHRVLYPKDAFRAWCSQVKIVNGVPHMNLPVDTVIPLPGGEEPIEVKHAA